MASVDATAPTTSSPRRKRRLAVLLGVAATVGLMVLLAVKLRYGGGETYPAIDQGRAPVLEATAIEEVLELPFPPGNVTSSANGRVFFNYNTFAATHRFTNSTFFELVDDEAVPYPDEASQHDLRYAFGMTVDSRQRLWVTCPATLDRAQTRLLAYDLNTGRKVVDHLLEEGVGRFAQDIRASLDGSTLFLADTGVFEFAPASLLVVDTETFAARVVVEDHHSVRPQDWAISTPGGPYRVGFGLLTFVVGVDGIAVSPDGQWLYYAAMSHDSLFRIPTAALQNTAHSNEALAAAVERVGPKPLSDGIATSADGRILVTDVEHGAIAEVTPQGQVRTLVRHPRANWSDSVTVTNDGTVYFTDSPTYLDPLLRKPTESEFAALRPFHLHRFRLPPR